MQLALAIRLAPAIRLGPASREARRTTLPPTGDRFASPADWPRIGPDRGPIQLFRAHVRVMLGFRTGTLATQPSGRPSPTSPDTGVSVGRSGSGGRSIAELHIQK
jgi:hypothetical protein